MNLPSFPWSNTLVYLSLKAWISPTKTPSKLQRSVLMLSGVQKCFQAGRQEEPVITDVRRRCMEPIPFLIIPNLLLRLHKPTFPPESCSHVLKIISSGRVIEWVAVFKWNWWNGGVCADGECVYKYAPKGQRLIPIDSAAVCVQHRWETVASVGNQLAQIHDKSYWSAQAKHSRYRQRPR